MVNQSLTARNLSRLITNKDIYSSKVPADKRLRLDALEIFCREALAPGFAFGDFNVFHMSHGKVVSPKNFRDDVLIRKINDNIARAFNSYSEDRNRVLPQIKSLLSEQTPFFVIKIDIERFFESIPLAQSTELIYENNNLDFETKRLLRALFSKADISGGGGLVRGIPLSTTISELYMRDFDDKCRRLDGVYFYARYVDDIFIISFIDRAYLDFEGLLPAGLRLNLSKCKKISVDRDWKVSASDGVNSMPYLGYEFGLKNVGNKGVALTVRISKKRVDRIKRRICLAISKFISGGDYLALKRRIRFLSSNYSVGKDSYKGNLYAGIYFSNILADSDIEDDLRGLDSFLARKIFARNGRLGAALTLSDAQRREICKHSFLAGHKQRIVRKFTPVEYMEIKDAWRNV